MAEPKRVEERSLADDDDSDSDDSDFMPGRPASSSGSGGSDSNSSNSDSDSDSDDSSSDSKSSSEKKKKEKEKKKNRSIESSESSSSSSDSSTSDGESSGDSDDELVQTEEAAEAAAQQQFRAALLSLVDGDVDEARESLIDLLHSPLLQKFQPNDIDDFDWSSEPPAFLSTMSRLFCAVNKNLATICSDAKEPDAAMGYLLSSLTIDRSSVSLWHQLGLECVKANHLGLANFAFRQGLKWEADNFECLDKLICVLYLSSDYSGCLCFIKQALTLNANYTRGLVLKETIINGNPYLREQTKKWFPDPDFEIAPMITDEDRRNVFAKLQPLLDRKQRELTSLLSKPSIPYKPQTALSGFDWSSFGTSLCLVYDEMEDNGIPSTRYVDLSDWHSTVEEELKRRATKGVSTVESQTPAIDEQPTPMDSSAVEECINDANKAIDDSIAVRATIDALVDGVVEGEEISQFLDEIIQQVEENAKLVKTPLSTAANTVKRHRRSAMRRFPSMVTSDSDSDAASIYKRRSSRLVPGFAIEDNFLNAAKPLPLSDLLESFLPKNLTAARASQRTPSKATLPAKDNNPQTTNHGMASVVEELREASDEQLLRIAGVLAESRETSLVDVIKQFLLSLRPVTLTHRLPNSLKAIYIDCYDRWRPHVQFKSPLDAIEGAANLESVVEHGWLHLTATEVWMSMEKGRSEAQRMRKALGRVSYLARFVEELGHEYSIRAHCLLASVTGVTVEDQFCHLSAAQALLQQSACKQLLVPNAPLQSISEAEIDGRLRRLEQATMLASVGQLFDQDNFERVATLLTDSWESGWSTTSLDAQAINYVLLVSSLTKLTRVSEGVHWAAKALSALLHLLIDARDLALHWRQTAKVIDCLDTMCTSADFAKTTAIDEGDLQSLASSLIKLIMMRMDANASCPLSVVKPWIVLYAIASRAEKEELRKSALSERYRSVGSSKVQLATDSLMILRTAHSKLGERGQCVADGGRLLLFLVEELRTAMQDPVLHDLICAKDARFKAIKDHMLNEAEQCFFCLYKFPSKKKRHLFEHKCSPLELTWKRAGPVFEFVLPDKHEIPAFDDVITNLISSDAVQLLQRMSKLVPKADCPDSSLEHFDNYVGNLSRLGEDWPTLDSSSATSDRWIVGEMYYLMGDYCFKTGDFARAIDYYRRHLIVAGRSDHSFNSWGGCALAGAAILATYLQHSDSFATTYSEMKKLSTATLFAFETALSINASHRILHTEYADAAYQLRAHLARGLRTLGLDDSRRNEIKQRCSALLANAKEHFHCALLLIGQDGTTSGGSESWLCRYFLGKIGEKEGASPSEVLSNYHRSAVLMMRDGARYADRINYKPKRYELESLEVHYRVHAAVIKWLTKREQWPLTDLRVMLRYLHMFVEHGVSRRKVAENDRNAAWYRFHEDPEVVGALDSVMDELPDEAEGDVEACVSDLVEMVAIEEELFEMCIEGMKLCIRRFQNHYYKAFYRLAQCYFSVDCVQNVKRASLVLFGPICRKELGLSSGLFQSRKPTNFFENLWRIPIEEIDRNGSFPMHMARCCWLAIAIASKLEDYAALIDIVVPLSRKPTDPKLQYVSEQNRNKLCNAASRCGLRAAHQWLKRSRPDNNLKRFCIQVYQAVRLLVKNRAPFADAWNDLLRAAFKPLMSSLPANLTNLDTQIMEQCEAWIAQSTEKKRANSLAHRFDSAAKRRRVEEIAPTSQRQLQKQLKRTLPSDDHHGATMVSVGAADSSTVEESPAKVARVNSDQSRSGRFSVDDLLTVSSSQDSQHSTISDSNIPDEPADDASLSADIPRSAGSSDKPIFLDDSF